MKVKDLIKMLQKFPEDFDVFYQAYTATGNMSDIWNAKADKYGFFGESLPCVILDDSDPEEELSNE